LPGELEQREALLERGNGEPNRLVLVGCECELYDWPEDILSVRESVKRDLEIDLLRSKRDQLKMAYLSVEHLGNLLRALSRKRKGVVALP
jgi:hypothetical protein